MGADLSDLSDIFQLQGNVSRHQPIARYGIHGPPRYTMQVAGFTTVPTNQARDETIARKLTKNSKVACERLQKGKRALTKECGPPLGEKDVELAYPYRAPHEPVWCPKRTIRIAIPHWHIAN